MVLCVWNELYCMEWNMYFTLFWIHSHPNQHLLNHVAFVDKLPFSYLEGQNSFLILLLFSLLAPTSFTSLPAGKHVPRSHFPRPKPASLPTLCSEPLLYKAICLDFVPTVHTGPISSFSCHYGPWSSGTGLSSTSLWMSGHLQLFPLRTCALIPRSLE